MSSTLNFPYDPTTLTWLDKNHTTNKENIYCYCAKALAEDIPFVRCDSCKQKFHCACVPSLKTPLLLGDVFYLFTCSVCGKGHEHYKRDPMSWSTITHLVLYHLMATNRKKEYFRWKEDICKLIDDLWDYLNAGKDKSATWHNTVASVLSTHPDTFLSGTEKFSQSGWWSLKEVAPPDKKKRTKDTRSNKRKAPAENPRFTRSPASRGTDKKRKQFYYTDSEADDRSATESQSKQRTSPKKKTKTKIAEMVFPSSPSSGSLSDLSDLSSDSSDEILPAKKSGKSPRSAQKPMGKPKMSTLMSTKSSIEQTLELDDESEQNSPKKIKTKANRKSQIPSCGSPVKSRSGKSTGTPVPSVTRQSPAKSSALSKKQTQVTPAIKVKQEDSAAKQNKATGRKGKAQRANLAVITKLGRTGDASDNVTPDRLTAGSAKEQTPKPTEPDPETEATPPTPVEIELERIPYYSSFASRLYGDPRLSSTLTAEEAWMGPWRGRKLKPYIWRDYESYPLKAQLLDEIQMHFIKNNYALPRSPIDFCYFQKEHLTQVNELLSRRFWPGIDMSKALLYPEFSVVVLYRRLVIGCAFMTPEAYITYVAVDSGWEGAGIGAFMLYHLIQTSVGLDVTLHVSANNPAMLLYQKFGFKPEQFIVKFYDKYLPESSWACKNAFLVRRRR